MQANPNDEMDRQYQNLTKKQRAVVDAHAQNPDATNREKARIAGEEILGEGGPVNESYCSEILNQKYADLAEYRAELEQNERPQGQTKTVGDPFEEFAQGSETSSQGFQTIQDRPVKATTEADDEQQAQPEPLAQADRQAQPQSQRQAQPQFGTSSPIQVADTGDGIAIKLSYRYVQQLLESQQTVLPDDLHQEIVNVVLQRAFN